MDLTGRRKSSNVEDRRGKGGKIALGGGLGGVIVAVVIALLMGKDPSGALQQLGETQQTSNTEFVASEQEQELEIFASQILASTEDVWGALFKKMGRTYEAPKLVLFKGSVQSGCGGASASSGPFYCSADRSVYIDLDFFADMQKTIGAGGDFAYAYVIAHEVGHHVQNLLGDLGEAHRVDSIPLGYWEMTANRLYYAAYYAASALLLNHGFSVQTHNGIIQMLGLHFIKTCKLSRESGTLYGRLFSLRQTGDYGDTFDLTEEDVKPLVEPTKDFIDAISTLLTS